MNCSLFSFAKPLGESKVLESLRKLWIAIVFPKSLEIEWKSSNVSVPKAAPIFHIHLHSFRNDFGMDLAETATFDFHGDKIIPGPKS